MKVKVLIFCVYLFIMSCSSLSINNNITITKQPPIENTNTQKVITVVTKVTTTKTPVKKVINTLVNEFTPEPNLPINITSWKMGKGFDTNRLEIIDETKTITYKEDLYIYYCINVDSNNKVAYKVEWADSHNFIWITEHGNLSEGESCSYFSGKPPDQIGWPIGKYTITLTAIEKTIFIWYFTVIE
jgi:hypothetical protein